MPDDKEAPGQGTADEPLGMREAFEAAESALGTEGTGARAQAETQATEAVPAQAGTAVEEPEHVRWAKGIEGDFDPATGKFVEDRILKRAYELNRQNQAQAQQIQQIRQALQDPEVRAAIQERLASRQQPAAAQTTQPVEKTDEQVLEEFVMERVERRLQPLLERIVPRVEQYRQERVVLQQDQVYAQIREEFGQEADGSYVYDKIAPTVAEAFDTAAARLGATREALVSALVDRGQLFGTIRSIARDVDYDRQRQAYGQQMASQQATTADAKRRTRLSPGRGASSGALKPSKEINSVADAWEAAEAALNAT